VRSGREARGRGATRRSLSNVWIPCRSNLTQLSKWSSATGPTWVYSLKSCLRSPRARTALYLGSLMMRLRGIRGSACVSPRGTTQTHHGGRRGQQGGSQLVGVQSALVGTSHRQVTSSGVTLFRRPQKADPKFVEQSTGLPWEASSWRRRLGAEGNTRRRLLSSACVGRQRRITFRRAGERCFAST
jgi:hypothetical protein